MKKAVEEWWNEAGRILETRSVHDVHIDMLLGDVRESEYFDIARLAYSELLGICLREKAVYELMPSLVLDVGWTDEPCPTARPLKELTENIQVPPSLILLKRDLMRNLWLLEEYRRPLLQNLFRVSHGRVICYFKTARTSESVTEFQQTVHFEYYPSDLILD